jgi:hypothetical protein
MHSRSKLQRPAPKPVTSPAPGSDLVVVATEASAHAVARRASMRQLIARSVLHGPALRSLLAADR